MRLLLAALVMVATMSGASAQLQWPTCDSNVPSGFASKTSEDVGLRFKVSCTEILVEDVKAGASEALLQKISTWQEIWKALRFPPRVFRYQLLLAVDDYTTEVLISDTESNDENRADTFVRSPYVRIMRSFAFRVPACRQMTISFLSPWPPKLRHVNVFWSEAAGAKNWEVNTSWPIVMALPNSWGNNPAAAFGHFFAEDVKVEPLDTSDDFVHCRK